MCHRTAITDAVMGMKILLLYARRVQIKCVVVGLLHGESAHSYYVHGYFKPVIHIIFQTAEVRPVHSLGSRDVCICMSLQ